MVVLFRVDWIVLRLWVHSTCSQTWLESHCLQHQPLYNNTHVGNCFTGLCTKCPGYNNNLVITAHFSGTEGVVVNKFDCITFTDMGCSSDRAVFTVSFGSDDTATPKHLHLSSPSNKTGTYYQRYLLSQLVYVHEVWTGTEWGVLTNQEYVLNQVLTIRVGLCTWGIHRDRMRSTYYPGVCTKPGTY